MESLEHWALHIVLELLILLNLSQNI